MNPLDARWQALADVALLGCEHQPLPAEAGDDACAQFCAALPAADAPQALLDRLAVLALARRAGHRPPPLAGAAPAAPADEVRPPCRAAADAVLATLLAQADELLPEWLALAGTHGVGARPERVPALLDRAARDTALRPATARACGRLGAWLAAQNPDWRWRHRFDAGDDVGDGDDDGAVDARRWHEGSPEQRRGWLAARRRHAPDDARARLAAEWPREKADVRRLLLGALAEGLAPADEPFLEAALDDRAASVRTLAAGLLLRLPASALRARHAARLAALTTYAPPGQPGLVDRLLARTATPGVLEVALPPEPLPPDWVRDGIDARPPKGVGPRVHALVQLVAALPPSLWADAHGLAPATACALWLALEAPLPAAYVQALLAHADADWAAAALACPGAERLPTLLALTGRVPEALRVPVLAARLAAVRGPLHDPDVQALLAAVVQSADPAALAGPTFDFFARRRPQVVHDYAYWSLLRPWLRVAPVAEAVAELAAARAAAAPALHARYDELLALLELRERLQAAFLPAEPR